MSCDCINKMASLASERLGVKCRPMAGTNLKTGKYIAPPLECIEETEKRRKQKINIYGNYCPFCGDRYEPKASDEGATG